MDQTPQIDQKQTEWKVYRFSPHRLLRQPFALPLGGLVKAELHNGRIMVRFESPSPSVTKYQRPSETEA